MCPCAGYARMLQSLHAQDLSFAEMIPIDRSDQPRASTRCAQNLPGDCCETYGAVLTDVNP